MKFFEKLFGPSQSSYEQLETEANALERSRQFNEAAEVWKKSIELHPTRNKWVYSNVAACLFQAGQKEEALGWMEKAVEQMPGDSNIQRNYGVLLMDLGHFDEAESCFIASYNIDPNNWIAHINYAEVNEKKGNREEAVKRYRYIHDNAMGTSAWRLAFDRLKDMDALTG